MASDLFTTSDGATTQNALPHTQLHPQQEPTTAKSSTVVDDAPLTARLAAPLKHSPSQSSAKLPLSLDNAIETVTLAFEVLALFPTKACSILEHRLQSIIDRGILTAPKQSTQSICKMLLAVDTRSNYNTTTAPALIRKRPLSAISMGEHDILQSKHPRSAVTATPFLIDPATRIAPDPDRTEFSTPPGFKDTLARVNTPAVTHTEKPASHSASASIPPVITTSPTRALSEDLTQTDSLAMPKFQVNILRSLQNNPRSVPKDAQANSTVPRLAGTRTRHDAQHTQGRSPSQMQPSGSKSAAVPASPTFPKRVYPCARVLVMDVPGFPPRPLPGPSDPNTWRTTAMANWHHYKDE